MLKKVTTTLNGVEYVLESGVWARQAGGSAVLRWGKIVLMANATGEKKASENVDFFPLTVEYREKFYATGKIPGGYIKKETRPSDKEILISRLTDRPIRPLFGEDFHNEVQLFVTLLSADKENSADVHAITVASASLMISNLPFNNPVAGVRVCRIDGKFIAFATIEQQQKSDINLVIAGTKNAVTMIEGNADEVSEEDMIAAVKFGHQEIIKLCQLQVEFAAIAKSQKPAILPAEKPDHSALMEVVQKVGFEKIKKANAEKDKLKRYTQIDLAMEESLNEIKEILSSKGLSEDELNKELKISKSLLAELEVNIVRDQIFNDGVRADGRKLEDIRDISIQVGVLPGVHGSAVFTRGETQSLGVATLGSDSAEQIQDDIEGNRSKRFYLHYNFPPYSVGEVRRYTGGGRREIGHGQLAENSLKAIIPAKEKFPYVIRVVSEIMESNGSSSMASVCTGTLSMMDAGIPIKAPVAGIAMGLITKGDKFAVLSDIAGLEDHFGDMDFKVAGSEKGITGFQLDLKVEGISYEIMEKAMAQAKKGRLHILGIMKQAIANPRNELSPNAPQIITLTIDKEKIGELIGPGGKNIRGIIERTQVEINVDDSGLVKIMATDAESGNKALQIIKDQFAELEVNKVYEGKVKTITDFGAFIEVLPGKEGLCHISKISDQRVAKVSDVLSLGQVVKVKVLAVDRQGKVSLSIKDAE